MCSVCVCVYVAQVWFQNRRAKFRRNERSIVAQRAQLQQFAAAASVSRGGCAGSSPSQLIDDLSQRQRHLQPPYVPQSTAAPVSTSTSSWLVRHSLPPPPHYAQSAASRHDATSAAPLSTSCYNSPSTDSGALQRHALVVSDDVQSSAADVAHQRITEFTTSYATQTTTSF